MILSLSDMTATEVARLDRSRTCVVIPVSPIEEHGPHLPLSTDMVESEGVARRLCERLDAEERGWTFLFYPCVPIGADGFDYPGTAEVRASTVRAVVRDIGLSFARHGFSRIMLANHHGGPTHNLALDSAARAIERRSRARVLSISGRLIVDLYLRRGLEAFFELAATPERDLPALRVDCHAGAFETAEMLTFKPELVRDGWRELEPVLVPVEKLTQGSALVEARGLGYFGAPALASRDLGERYIDFLVERVLPDARRFLAGERVRGLELRWRLLLAALTFIASVRRRFDRRARAKLPATSRPVEINA